MILGDAAAAAAPASWDTGATNAATWDSGTAAFNNDTFNENGFMTATDGAPMASGEGGGDDRACRICNEVGHLARECPSKPEGFGKCFNCGEEGHSKADCPNPRVFNGTCRICSQEGHQARECPDKPPVVCRNCKEEGHITSECTNNKVFDYDNVETLPAEEAWANVVKTAKEAVETRDLDDFRDAIKVYHKAVKDISYLEIERSFRTHDIGIYLIATEPKDGEILDTHTLINLSGKKDCKYKLGYFFKKTPRTAKLAEGWPSSEAENLERLKDAGVPYERGIPKCLRCKGNLVILPLIVPSHDLRRVLSARDAKKIAPTIPVVAGHVATAGKKAIWQRSAKSPKTLPTQRAATVIRLAILARTVLNLATGAKSSVTLAARWVIPSSAVLRLTLAMKLEPEALRLIMPAISTMDRVVLTTQMLVRGVTRVQLMLRRELLRILAG
ncbi:MAG: hypothetical protein Q9225_002831 [Loekoesia sp. 1 TL-2023]